MTPTDQIRAASTEKLAKIVNRSFDRRWQSVEQRSVPALAELVRRLAACEDPLNSLAAVTAERDELQARLAACERQRNEYRMAHAKLEDRLAACEQECDEWKERANAFVHAQARLAACEQERDEWIAKADELARMEFIGDPVADARVRKAEARLAKAEEALRQIAARTYNEDSMIARTALAAIAETDEPVTPTTDFGI